MSAYSPQQSRRIFTSTAAATVTGTASETTLIGSGVGSLTLPANILRVGSVIEIKARGRLTSAVAATAVVFKIKLGSNIIIATGNLAPVNSQTDRSFGITAELVVRTIGASGTVMGNGMIYNTAAASFSGITTSKMDEFQSTSAVTVDTTASQAIDLTVTLTSGAGVDSYTLEQVIIYLSI
jgi:hypothetical protein